MVNKVSFDRLNYAFAFAVNQNSLHAKEGLFDAVGVVYVDIVV